MQTLAIFSWIVLKYHNRMKVKFKCHFLFIFFTSVFLIRLEVVFFCLFVFIIASKVSPRKPSKPGGWELGSHSSCGLAFLS